MTQAQRVDPFADICMTPLPANKVPQLYMQNLGTTNRPHVGSLATTKSCDDLTREGKRREIRYTPLNSATSMSTLADVAKSYGHTHQRPPQLHANIAYHTTLEQATPSGGGAKGARQAEDQVYAEVRTGGRRVARAPLPGEPEYEEVM